MDLELVVFHRGAVRVVMLPPSGVVGIGRGPEQAVLVDDASVSRRHATLTIDDELVIEDEGSVNGTVVVRAEDGVPPPTDAGEVLGATARAAFPVRGPTRVGVGDTIFVGAVALLVRECAAEMQSTSPLHAIERLVEQIAPSPIRVLLLGETGVGKEVFAERIHARSPRARGPLVKVHCAGLAESLLESELFGHERGAFTGAMRSRVGLIEAASGGTLFLDEIGEMSGAVQVKLLRVLEDSKVVPVGSNEARAVDVRVISATHRDLARDVKDGRFRQDLYFRVNGISLRIPPLRERLAQIVPLAEELLRDAATRSGRRVRLDPGTHARLLAHPWPGNVRELRQVMERALALSTGDAILAEHVLLDDSPESVAPAPSDAPLKEELARRERERILAALDASGGNQTRAAESLGMPRRTLVERLRAWGMTRPRK